MEIDLLAMKNYHKASSLAVEIKELIKRGYAMNSTTLLKKSNIRELSPGECRHSIILEHWRTYVQRKEQEVSQVDLRLLGKFVRGFDQSQFDRTANFLSDFHLSLEILFTVHFSITCRFTF